MRSGGMRFQPLRILRGILLFCCGAIFMLFIQLAGNTNMVDLEPEKSVDQNALKLVVFNATSSTTIATTTIATPVPPKSANPSKVCGGSFPSKEELGAPEDWKSFHKKYYAYSAFYDLRINPVTLRITAVVPRMTPPKHPQIYCYVWYANTTEPVRLTAKVVSIGEGMSYKYQAVWLICNPPSNHEEPLAVGVSTSECDHSPAVTIPVVTPKPQSKPDHMFTVCICGPIKFNYSDSNQFVEWIETNSLFGAEKFVVYNHSSNDSLKPYVTYYQNQKRLDFRSWSLPLGNPDIKNFAHMVLLSDCMYRNMYRSKYIAFLDLDELLIPKESPTWLEVLKKKNCEDNSSVNFRNVFYKLEWDQDEVISKNQTIRDLGLKSLMYSKRENKIWPHRSRSKYIVRPENILEPGVHFPHKYLGPKSNCDIGSNVAWVQHYRWWDDPGPTWTVDRTMTKYADRLVRAAQLTHTSVKGA